MSDLDANDIWECVKALNVGDTVEYKFATDNWAIPETLDSSFSFFINFN